MKPEDLNLAVTAIQRRITDLENRVGSGNVTKIVELPLTATNQSIVLKINELIKIFNTRLR